MENHLHSFKDLFAQLGLANDEAAISAFLRAHAGLAPEIALSDAPFWSPTQAQFLCAQKAADSDWVDVIDHLDTALRG